MKKVILTHRYPEEAVERLVPEWRDRLKRNP